MEPTQLLTVRNASNTVLGAIDFATSYTGATFNVASDVITLVESPEISQQITKLGADPLPMSIAQFEAMIARELKENAELIKKAGIKTN